MKCECRKNVVAMERMIADLNLKLQDKIHQADRAFEMLAQEASRADRLSAKVSVFSANELQAARQHEEALVRIAEKDAEIEQLLVLSSSSPGQPTNISVLTAELAALKAAEKAWKLEEKQSDSGKRGRLQARAPLQAVENENQALRAKVHELCARETQLLEEKAAALDQVMILERRVAESRDRIRELESERAHTPQAVPSLRLQSLDANASLEDPDESSSRGSLSGRGYQRLHNNVRALNDLVQDTRALRLSSPRGTPRSPGARTPRICWLHSGAASIMTARPSRASREGDLHEPTATSTNVTLKIGIKFSSAGEAGSRQRAQFDKDLVRDLAHASGLPRTSFVIKSVSPGSVVVNLDICAERSSEVAQDLARQCQDSASLLCGGVVTRKVETLAISSFRPLPRLPRDAAETEYQERSTPEGDEGMLLKASDLLSAAMQHFKGCSPETGGSISDGLIPMILARSPPHRLFSLAEEIEKQVWHSRKSSQLDC